MTVESRSVVVRLSMEAAQYIRDAQKVGTVTADAMQKVEQSTDRASKAQGRAERSTSSASKAMGLLGFNTETAALAVGTYAVVASANFEQAMSGVQAATHASAAEMDLLRDAALDAGAETSFSATEAAAGIENLSKAGLDAEEILGGGLAGSLDLAAAGGLDVASAAEAAAGALAQFKLDGDQAAHVADLLAAGAGKAQGDVSDMVLALKQAGTVSAQTGLSLEETVGSLSALAEQSLLGSDAGTSFKTFLASLTPNSKAAAQAMELYNIQAFDAQGNFVGMTELAGQLQAGLGDLTDEQRAMALETIFGSDAVRAASIIYDNGAEGIANWTASVDDAGYAAETASIKLDNLKGDFEALRGAIETAFIEEGSGDQEMLRGITQLATDAVNVQTEVGKADGILGGFRDTVMSSINPLGSLGNTYTGLKDTLTGSDEKTEDLDSSTESLAQTAVTAAGGLEAQARAAEGAGEAAKQTAADIEAAAEALKKARDEARGTASEFFNLGDSLDDSKVSLSDWITEMAEQAAALENFTDNAKKAAKNGLRDGLIAALEDAGPAGALRMKQLANATDEEITRANKAWARGQKAIDAYVDTVVKVPRSQTTDLQVKAIKAIADLIAFRARLDEATKDRIFSITTVYKTVRSASDALPDRAGRKAGGGQIIGPGTPTSDSVPIWASNKEYVVRAAAVDHYGVGFFDAANAMRLAGGGSTNPKKRRKGTGEISGDTLFTQYQNSQAAELADAQAAQAAERYYDGLERAQREADQRAETAQREADQRAERDAQIAEAVLAGQQRAWDAATDAAQAQVDASKAMVESVQANMDRLGSAAVAGFDSPLFSKDGRQSGLWAGGTGAGGGWRDALTGDIAGLAERSSLITQLSAPGMGLSADALEALLGQADNTQIADLIGRGEVNEYATLFAERARLRGSVSTQAGLAGYGQEYAAALEQQTITNQKLDLLTAVIAAARPITVTETISAAAMVAEIARLQEASGGY